MKKSYIKPQTDVHNIEIEYVMEHHSGKPGHGYGDDNHGHDGPPGQNKDEENPIKERDYFHEGLWN